MIPIGGIKNNKSVILNVDFESTLIPSPFDFKRNRRDSSTPENEKKRKIRTLKVMTMIFAGKDKTH